MSAARRSVVLMGALLLLGMARPSAVLAHAGLLRSDPQDLCTSLAGPLLPPSDPRCASGVVLARSPAVVRLWFTEPVQAIGQAITVVGPGGRRVEHGAVHGAGVELSVAVDARQTGTYLVSWRVISGDTHVVRGHFAFSVGRASVVPGVAAQSTAELGGVAPLGLILQVIARWLHFAGYALSFGPVSFRLLVLRRLGAGHLGAGERRMWGLAGVGIMTLLLAAPVALLAQTASLGVGEMFDGDVISQTLASSFGRVLAQQVGAAVGLWVLAGVAREGSGKAGGGVLGLGLLLALIDGQASHAASAGPPLLGLGANTVHVAAMGVWVGGLATLLAIWDLPEVDSHHGEVVASFGRVAAASLVLLTVTGEAMAVLHLTRPADLLTTAYGRTLAAKSLALPVAVLLALAGTRTQYAGRRKWWRWEAAVLMGVLALAGLLVSLPPPA